MELEPVGHWRSEEFFPIVWRAWGGLLHTELSVLDSTWIMGAVRLWVCSRLALWGKGAALTRLLWDLLGHVVHARYEMRELKEWVLEQMAEGYRPTVRGEPVPNEVFSAIEAASVCLDMAFMLLKGVQAPPTLPGRLVDARQRLSECSGFGLTNSPT